MYIYIYLYIHTWWIHIYTHTFILIYVYPYIHMNIHIYTWRYIHSYTCIRMTHDDHRHPHNPRHMLDTARVCEGMRVYVYLVDGLYRRAELNKHAHCIRVPKITRQHQGCHTLDLPALAGDYSTEVNSIRWERARALKHVHLSIHAYIHTYTNITNVYRYIFTKKRI